MKVTNAFLKSLFIPNCDKKGLDCSNIQDNSKDKILGIINYSSDKDSNLKDWVDKMYPDMVSTLKLAIKL